mgnify:CR=1 FL=1
MSVSGRSNFGPSIAWVPSQRRRVLFKRLQENLPEDFPLMPSRPPDVRVIVNSLRRIAYGVQSQASGKGHTSVGKWADSKGRKAPKRKGNVQAHTQKGRERGPDNTENK